tara:strand:- start:174 stop:1106 length:933 start_codon:yes stop_codon:yes gene_type:complete
MSFETYNLSLIDDIVRTVWNSSDIKEFYYNPIILQEEDVGHIDNFLLELEKKLLYLCLQILPKDFIIIEKTKKAVFYDDSGSDYDSDNDYNSDNELPITPPIFLDTLPEEKKLVIFKVKKTMKKYEKLSILKESFKTKEMKKEEEKPQKVLNIQNEWKSQSHFCDISFDKNDNDHIFSNLPEIKKPQINTKLNFEGNFKRRNKKQPTLATNVLSTIFNMELTKIKPKNNCKKITKEKQKNSEKNIKCTKLCIFREKGCSKHKKGCCNFAHTFEEWNPVICNFNSKCKKYPKCTFFHPKKETKLEYYNRTK